MNDKPENASAQPDLAAAIRQAQVENAERAEAIADLRKLEIGRLALLESALRPVVGQAPPGVDLFDLALAKGDHPRLFLDMIAFVDLAHDRRTYRFYQDTRHGRVLIAKSQSIDKIAAAVANYVARRLVERERALASDWRDAEAPKAEDKGPLANAASGDSPAPPIPESEAKEVAAEPSAPRRRRFARRTRRRVGSLWSLPDVAGVNHARALDRPWRLHCLDDALALGLGPLDRRAADLK